MRSVGLKVLKNKLSEYVRLATAGETVLVTDREKVVAELRPPTTQAAPGVKRSEAEILDDLVRRGVLTPARKPLSGPPTRLGLVPFDELMRDLDESRSDR